MFLNGDVFLWVVVINDRDSLNTTSSYGVRIVPFGKCATVRWEKPNIRRRAVTHQDVTLKRYLTEHAIALTRCLADIASHNIPLR